jgi:hypothetical protein
MAFRTTLDIDADKLAQELERIDEIADRVRLAGYGLAAPLFELRRAQMAREAVRAAAKKGADHPEVAARRAALARTEARLGSFREEVSRARLDPPALKTETGAGVWGRVAADGIAVEGATVVALAREKRAGFACTDANGAFALEMPSGAPILLSVRSKEGKEIYRDQEAETLAAGQLLFREIDLTRGASVPCPEPPPDTPPTDTPPPPDIPPTGTFPMPDLVGQQEAAARVTLRTRNLALGERVEKATDSQHFGRVLAQTPAAGAPVKPGDKVSLVIGIADTIAVPALTGMTLEAAQKTLKTAELALGDVTRVPAAPDKAGLVVGQNPVAGTPAARGDKVSLVIGIATRQPTPTDPSTGLSTGPSTLPSTGPRPDETVQKIASLAEARLRQSGIASDAPAGFLLQALAAAGVANVARLNAFLAQDRQVVREQLGLRTLAEADRATALLKRARVEVAGN